MTHQSCGVPRLALSLACTLLLAPACTGDIGTHGGGASGGGDRGGATAGAGPGGNLPGNGGGAGPGTTGKNGGAPGTTGGTTGGTPAAGTPGLLPMRRLGRTEYLNTLQALLGSGVSVSVTLPSDPLGPANYAWPSDVGAVELDLFQQAANDAAASVATKLGDLAPCQAGHVDRACAADFIQGFGPRVFRRPLLQSEVDDLLALYDAQRVAPISDTHADAMTTLLGAMLQSPQFLYHWELGPNKPARAGAQVRLNGWEMASRLSYLIWASMPDQALFAAASSGALDTPAGVETQARRLLADTAHARQLPISVIGQWIAIDKLAGLAKDKKAVPLFDDGVRAAMQSEMEQFVSHAVLEDGHYRTLLTSHDSYVNASLAKLYGLTGITGNAMVARTLPPERTGLFTQGAFLAIEALPQESSPVRRGKAVVERLLCRRIAPPPPNINAMPPAIPDGIQTRKAYEQHKTDPVCGACHGQMDPIGFAFENFDAGGKYRATEAGAPVDTTGAIPALDGKDAPFKDAGEMMTAIIGSNQGRDCVASQFMAYALGRPVGDGDAASLAATRAAFERSDLDMRELIVALVTSDAFRLRTPTAGEVLE